HRLQELGRSRSTARRPAPRRRLPRPSPAAWPLHGRRRRAVVVERRGSNEWPACARHQQGESMRWNAWEVFDPRDGQTKHFTDREGTAEQIAVEEEQRTGEPRDYGRKGMEPDGRGGWSPWCPAFHSQARLSDLPEIELDKDESLDLPPADEG